MKKIIIFCLLLLLFSSYSYEKSYIAKVCKECDSRTDESEISDLPRFEQADWYESTDILYGLHHTSVIEFSDGIRGKIFRGGYSKKFFIGGKTGGKFYYINQVSAVRALYLYKKYDCISNRYRN